LDVTKRGALVWRPDGDRTGSGAAPLPRLRLRIFVSLVPKSAVGRPDDGQQAEDRDGHPTVRVANATTKM